MADTTSQSLLQRVAVAQDPDAWQRLAGLYTPLLRRWMVRYGLQAHDADDLVQEVLGAVHRKLPWDREFDQHVLDQALAAVRPEFQPSSWEAFHRTAIEGQPTEAAAETLGMTANAIRLARMRVMRRLREELAAFQEW